MVRKAFLKPGAPPPMTSDTVPKYIGPGTAAINEIIVPIPNPVVRCLGGNTSVQIANKPGNTSPEQNMAASAATI